MKRTPLPPGRRQELRERAENRCEDCGAGEQLQVHHRLPVKCGGDHSLANLQLLCHPCHVRADVALGARGRPVGRDYGPPMHFRLLPVDLADLEKLATCWRCSDSEVIRRAIREAARYLEAAGSP